MKRYRMFRRHSGIFFMEETQTKKQESLRTRHAEEAERLVMARNESVKQSGLNLQIARAYLMGSDPAINSRIWQHVMDES